MLTRENIERFIDEYKTSRVCIETTVRAKMNRLMEYEEKYNKAFTDFTQEEALNMYKEMDAVSVVSLMNTNLMYKHAYNWIQYNFNDSSNANDSSIYESITKDQLETCVNKEKKNAKRLTREEINGIEGELYNATDKAIIELLFLGAGGDWTKELTYLDKDQVSLQDMSITFITGKKISIDKRVYSLLQNAFDETEMISYNPDTSKISKVESRGIYKSRFNALYPNTNNENDADKERRFRWVQRRLNIITEYLGTKKLTTSSIQESGLLHEIKLDMDRLQIGFKEYTKTPEAKILANRYDITSKLYPQILFEKLRDEF